MTIQIYSKLPKEAKDIRIEVFMEEQGFQNEFDEVDEYALHLVLFMEGKAAATCRCFFHSSMEQYLIGRIAVRRQWRGQNIGSEILKCAEAQIVKQGGTGSMLSAQQRAVPFYEKSGYQVCSDPYDDEGCPHVWMKKELRKND